MKKGYFGTYGGAFIPEILHETFQQLTAHYEEARRDKAFWAEYIALMENYSGRPTPLTFAANLSEQFNKRIYIKREDLNQTGAHKANNVMGQGLMVKRMGKTRLRGVKSQFVNFKHASLVEADLSGGDFYGADFHGAILDGAILDGAQFKGAKWIDGIKCKHGSIGQCNK